MNSNHHIIKDGNEVKALWDPTLGKEPTHTHTHTHTHIYIPPSGFNYASYQRRGHLSKTPASAILKCET